MKNKSIEFFLVKLLILAIIDAVLVLFYFALGLVLDTIGVQSLLGDATSSVVKYGVDFILFVTYSAARTYKFKINGQDDRRELGFFAVREGSIYAAFTLPLLIVALIVGVDGVPSWLSFVYAPHYLMYAVSGNVAVGFGVPVLIYTAIVTSIRLIAISNYKPLPPQKIEENVEE